MYLPAILTATFLAGACLAQPADLVVTGAHIWTGVSSQAEATALAVRGGRFVVIGDLGDVKPLIGESTVVVDADGQRIVPGLIDTHVHIQGASASLGRLDLRPARSKDDFLRLVREYAKTLGGDEWVIGRGWSAESWPDPTPPTPEEIEAASGGRPAVLTRMDGHSLIAGAEAIHRAGVTKDGPADPPGGKIGRKPDGAPTGAFFDQAMGIVASRAPTLPDRRLDTLLKEAIHFANRQGLTQVGSIDTRRFVESHLEPLDKRGALTLRVGVSVTSDADTVKSWTPILNWAAAHRTISDHIRVLGFKGYMDGSLGSRTAWMLKPYLDDPNDPNNVGFPLAMVKNGALEKLVTIAAKMGLQPAVHAIGDRANQTLLRWYEYMGPRLWDVRPRVEHAQHVAPEDILLFARMGVIPSMQPLHKADDGRYAEKRLGAERLRTSYAYRSLLDSGARLAFGSDWPVVTCNPFLGMAAAVTAKTITGETFLPEQSISIAEALMCYTSNAAWALHNELDTGVIQPGLLADFVILDRDILTVDPGQIGKTKVLKTFLGGELVYDAFAQARDADE